VFCPRHPDVRLESLTYDRPTTMAYWLFKSEPSAYSFADLLREPDQTTGWDGVRNYQARNMLRDDVKVGDGVLFYHSSSDPPCIAGIAKVVKAAHADLTAFDPKAEHYDPKSDRSNPTWYQVSIKAVRAIEPPLGLPLLNTVAELAGMELLRKGSRLSVQPVTEKQWKTILALAKRSKKR
jgi:predicted RNA-binding protein with PUA-like domain